MIEDTLRKIEDAVRASGTEPGRKERILELLGELRDELHAAASGSAEAEQRAARLTEAVHASTEGGAPAGGGLTELAASLLALKHGQLPGTLNHDDPDPACPVRVHTGAPRPMTKPYVVKVGFTQMGQCAAVVVKKFVE